MCHFLFQFESIPSYCVWLFDLNQQKILLFYQTERTTQDKLRKYCPRNYLPGTRVFLNMGEGNVQLALERSFELQTQLSEVENKDEKLEIIKEFLKTGHGLKLPVLPEFDKSEFKVFKTYYHSHFVSLLIYDDDDPDLMVIDNGDR